ncbi:hypothetical protein Ssi03_75540 [Sphaerisporangium siamense]|nr:hypothetical protein Ssi03_75540 [Sphaerisporangium siamense]
MAFIPPPPPKLDALSRIPHPPQQSPPSPYQRPKLPTPTPHNALTSTAGNGSHVLPATGRPRPLSDDCRDVPQDSRQASSQGPAVTADATTVSSDSADKGTSDGADDGTGGRWDRRQNQ